MAGGRLDFEKLNRTNKMRQNGSEFADDPKAPKFQPKARPEELVVGLSKTVKARTKEDQATLAKLERRFELWIKAPDISSLELDKLRRQISRLKTMLPPEKKKSFKVSGKRLKKKRLRP